MLLRYKCIYGSWFRGCIVDQIYVLTVNCTQHPYLCSVRKILNLRLFDDDQGKRWSKSVYDKQFEILCVSQVSAWVLFLDSSGWSTYVVLVGLFIQTAILIAYKVRLVQPYNIIMLCCL